MDVDVDGLVFEFGDGVADEVGEVHDRRREMLGRGLWRNCCVGC